MEDDTFLVTSSLGVMGNIIEIGETLQQSVSQRCAHFAICMTFCHKHVLRYESSTLILYKELSSTIFQSCE